MMEQTNQRKKVKFLMFLSMAITYWAHKASLTLPLFIEVSLPNQESVQSCISGVDFAAYDFSIGFWTRSDIVIFFYFI
jgi:hypothetical protein